MPAGDYTLTIDLPGDLTGAYAFRLSDLAPATPLTPGTPVSGSLDPANETDLYRSRPPPATASRSTPRPAPAPLRELAADRSVRQCRLQHIFNNTTSSDVGTTTLAQPGATPCWWRARIGDTGSGTYTFVVVPQGNSPPAPPPSTPLTLGSTVNAAISVAGEQDRYSFTLAGARCCTSTP